MGGSTEILVDGLAFPETPRWHDGRLWFTDQFARQVRTVSPEGEFEVALELDDRVGGLGWMPDGSLLVVSMGKRHLYRVNGGVELHSDLSSLAAHECNDMVVDGSGTAYVGHFGFDLAGGADPAPTSVLMVTPDGAASVAAENVIFPNGLVIEPGGGRLIVAETFAARVSAFAIQDDGRLGARTRWAQLDEETTPDGICLDAQGAVWVASFGTGEVLRLAEGGERLETIRPHGTPYACMLGGEARNTLYIATSENDDPSKPELRTGHIETAEVSVPGAGLP
ncbi:MAG: SMP-30/gluconolactonase/LRE family protein [Solirubrobacterales bacterium]